MELIRSTEIWKSTFGIRDACKTSSNFVRRLEQSFERFRDHALQFSRHLSQDLRQLTVHDETHTDALWEVFDILFPAAIIANPLETYVLGGAFLTHDLGHALCMYPDGVDQLKKTNAWRQATQMAARVGGSPESILQNAIRLNHASHAKVLAEKAFGDGKYLIDDAELRAYLGRTIGQIAFSHWWDHNKLNESVELEDLGAIPLVDCPGTWTVSPRKLSYILRVCDACQIDGRRAPIFTESLRKPTGVAAAHWGAQRHLAKPYESNGQIKYTSLVPFGVDSINAWWTAYDLAKIAASELIEAEKYFRSSSIRPRVNQVMGGTSPREFARHVRVEGWEPVDARPKISAVIDVISRLGGDQLYGSNLTVPLRELIQNSRDAIVAKRLIDRKPKNWGLIRVEVSTRESEYILTIADNGIGMSERTMLKYLLDFGTSYWQSNDCIEELPALDFELFNPVGKFGIGFFSVFMLGRKVKVVSRTSNDGKNQTRVIEFLEGLDARPLLRPARVEEQLGEDGTTIEIHLSSKNIFDRICTPKHERLEPFMQNASFRSKWKLSEAIAWECPASDVDILVSDGDDERMAVEANDWITISAEQLFRRVFLHRDDVDRILKTERSLYHIKSIEKISHPNGQILGRASLIDNLTPLKDLGLYGIITNGPFRASIDLTFPGVMIGSPTTASRNDARPIAIQNHLATSAWATLQAKHVRASSGFCDLQSMSGVSAYIRSLCGDMFDLAVYINMGRLVSLNDVVRDGLDFPEVFLFPVHIGMEPDASKYFDRDNPSHLGVTMGRFTNGKLLRTDDPLMRSDHSLWKQYWYSLWGAAIEAISIAWQCNLTKLLQGATSVEGQDDRILEPAVFQRPCELPRS